MLQPVTLTYRNAIPTGMMIDPSTRLDAMTITTPNPISGYTGIGGASLGDVNNLQLASLAATGASTTVGILTAIGTIGGPVGAAIAAGIGVAMAIAQFFKGCGQTCIQSSNDANQLEPYLKQNLQAYLSSPIRTKSMQAAAINNFMTVWNTLVQACSNPALAQAGQNCISDRQQGSCKWQTSPGGWTQNADGTCTYTYPGAAGSGSSCWNWWVGYHDPIASDPCVLDDSVLAQATGAASSTGTPAGTTTGTGAATGSTSTAASSSLLSGIPAPLLIGAGILVVLAFAGRD
jgi:hypothetical protein